MNIDAQTTTVFFTGGPWDGDECEFADPPSIVRVDGEMIAYYRTGKNDYRWGHRLTPTPAEAAVAALSSPALPLGKPKQPKRGKFLKRFAWFVLAIFVASLYTPSFPDSLFWGV